MSLTATQRCLLCAASSVSQVDDGGCSNTQTLAGRASNLLLSSCEPCTVALHDSSLQRVVAQAFPSARPDVVDAAFASPPSPSQLRLLQVLPLCPSLSHTPVSRPHFLSPAACSNSSLSPSPTKLLAFANSNPVQKGGSMMCAAGRRGRLSSPRTRSCATRPTTTLCMSFNSRK
jgi:hypothetical protein